jgi:hypothetical protein
MQDLPISPGVLAQEAGLTYGRIIQLIHEFKIAATRIGPKTWIISRAEADRWLRERERLKEVR